MKTNSISRREWFKRTLAAGVACGGCSLTGRILPVLATPDPEVHPLRAKAPHFAPRAKRVILFFLTGGASHVDSFDPKPELQKRAGEKYRRDQPLVPSPWTAGPYGKSGIVLTKLFPHIGGVVDELCLIRSMHGDHNDHFEATLHMHTGSNGSALPGLGAWVSYGLGTQNVNLPSHIVFAEHKPYAGAQVWDSNFLPAYHQGTLIQPGDTPIPNLKPQPGNPWSLQQKELEMLDRLNMRHMERTGHEFELAARMLSFKTAASIQRLAPELFDLSGETDETHDLYGLMRGDTESFAWQTLVARRMAEAGVRFIELIDTGSSNNWDAHSNIKSHERHARKIDQPIAGLIKDLKRRGMLEETLVICATEFGRTAYGPNNGRNHHCRAFSCWLAGGGVKPGSVYGATDELGLEVAEKPVHVHDFHATILHLLGLDHERLTYHHAGRDFRLTDVYGNVVNELLV